MTDYCGYMTDYCGYKERVLDLGGSGAPMIQLLDAIL